MSECENNSMAADDDVIKLAATSARSDEVDANEPNEKKILVCDADLENLIETMEDLLNKTVHMCNSKHEDKTETFFINALDLAKSASTNENLNEPLAAGNTQKSSNSINSLSESLSSKKPTDESSSLIILSYEQEITRLKDLIKAKEEENLNLDLKLSENEQQAKQKIEQLHLNFTQKLEQTHRKFQDMHKDKTSSMVMKYAEAEKKNIDLNRSIELSQSKLNDAMKEKQRVLERLEKSKLDNQKLNSEFESKIKEIMTLKQENTKLKEQIVINDAREKAAQLKLKTELESHVNSKRLIHKLNIEINELKKKLKQFQPSNDEDEDEANEDDRNKDEVDQTEIKKESDVNEIETNPSVQTAMPLNNAATINQKPPVDKEKDKLIRELYALKSQLKDMFEERTTLRDRVQALDQERKAQDITLNKYKETIQNQKQMNKELLNEILQLRELQETLTKEQLEKNDLKQKITLLTSELNDLRIDLSKSQEKQTELLSFTSKLTEKNTQLQSENTNTIEKLEQVEEELKQANKLIASLNESILKEKEELTRTLNENQKQIETLTQQLNESTKNVNELTTKLADEQDENVSIKKKNAANIKDLTRQLQTLQKKLTNASSANSSNNSNSILASTPTITTSTSTTFTSINSITPTLNTIPNSQSNNNYSNMKEPHFDRVSRTSSFSSFNDQFDNLNHTSNSSNKYNDDVRHDSSSSSTIQHNNTGNSSSNRNNYNSEVICGNEDVYVVDVDKQKVIEKVVSLQKTLAKRNEKIDFLQDHVNQLTLDLQRKTKIIQAYAMSEEVGSFTSEAQDAIKREMSRKTGIMSTLYNTNKSYFQTTQLINSNQSNMTMELCLEINSKLQALLEDTLIKNLTLKDSIDTLGSEIARLSQENRKIRLKE